MKKIRVEREFWNDCFAIAIIDEMPNGERYFALPATMREKTSDTVIEPMMRVHHEEGQFLMDELWRCGLRPTEGSGSAGSLAATERHLKDMQRISTELLAHALRLGLSGK